FVSHTRVASASQSRHLAPRTAASGANDDRAKLAAPGSVSEQKREVGRSRAWEQATPSWASRNSERSNSNNPFQNSTAKPVRSGAATGASKDRAPSTRTHFVPPTIRRSPSPVSVLSPEMMHRFTEMRKNATAAASPLLKRAGAGSRIPSPLLVRGSDGDTLVPMTGGSRKQSPLLVGGSRRHSPVLHRSKSPVGLSPNAINKTFALRLGATMTRSIAPSSVTTPSSEQDASASAGGKRFALKPSVVSSADVSSFSAETATGSAVVVRGDATTTTSAEHQASIVAQKKSQENSAEESSSSGSSDFSSAAQPGQSSSRRIGNFLATAARTAHASRSSIVFPRMAPFTPLIGARGILDRTPKPQLRGRPGASVLEAAASDAGAKEGENKIAPGSCNTALRGLQEQAKGTTCTSAVAPTVISFKFQAPLAQNAAPVVTSGATASVPVSLQTLSASSSKQPASGSGIAEVGAGGVKGAGRVSLEDIKEETTEEANIIVTDVTAKAEHQHPDNVTVVPVEQVLLDVEPPRPQQAQTGVAGVGCASSAHQEESSCAESSSTSGDMKAATSVSNASCSSAAMNV
ncbi:unnamed protein product, partial [Amoebophrya sp. A25]